jgi:CSLREA domain-containing protein
MKPTTRIILLALLILIGAYPLGARSSWAFNFTVNSFDDAVDTNPGDTFCNTQNDVCTLRAAIQEANSFPIQHNIALPAGTYILSLGELAIKENITINGTIDEAGKVSTFIDGSNASRIFKVSDGVPLTLNSLWLRQGVHTADGPKSGGGAIFNQGTVAAHNVTLTGNKGIDASGNVSYGGGIFNNGDLTLTYCTLSNNSAGNGGGLFNNGTAVVRNVTFDNSIAGSGLGVGGGIFNSGTLTLEKTTIRGRTDNGSVAGTGGGLFNDGIMDLVNVTISGNSATSSGGGIYNGSISTAGVVAQTTLTNVTISNNKAANLGGGSIFNKAGNDFAIKNTIIANSTGGNCAGIAINSNGHNIDDDFSCGLAHPTDQSPKNPNLGPLQRAIGEPTDTHALNAGSPAIAAIAVINAEDFCPDTDQRGYPRHSPCDIGAYEDTTDNPVPAITTLSPNSKPEGDPDFTLTVNGYTYTPFLKGLSTILWGGSPRTTTFVNASQLKADITAADLAVAGPVKVTVVNPGQGGGQSNEVVFTVTRANPFPTITSLSPDTRPAGGPPFTLTVNGTNYVDQSSVVRWNGIARPTTFVSDSQLTADITSDDLAAMGTASVTVSNSPPGGGISDPPAIFTIGPPILYLPIIIRN